MSPNVILKSTIYSNVNAPDDSGVYDYNLVFYFEGLTEPVFGVDISAFFSMKSLYTGEEQDLIASKSTFEFISNTLTEEDILWMLYTTHQQLRNYPLAQQDGIEDVLKAFPEVSNETAKINNKFIDWFYENLPS